MTNRFSRLVKKQLLKLANKVFRENAPEITSGLLARLVDESCNPNKNMVKKICEIYKEHIKNSDYNKHSLVVYSGCDNPTGLRIERVCSPQLFTGKQCSYFNFPCEQCFCFNLPREELSYQHSCRKSAISCLYTGDFNAKDEECWNKMKRHFSRKEWISIGCIQIPHHGSSGSYNNQFLKKKAWHVISAGLGNKYSHPSLLVLDKYLEKGDFPIVVTQDPRRCVCFLIYRVPGSRHPER